MAGEYMDELILRFERLVKQEYDNGEVIPMNELWNISYGLEAVLDPNKPKLVMTYLYATELTDYIGSDRHNFLLAALYDLNCTDYCQDLKTLTEQIRAERQELIYQGEAVLGQRFNI